jgi:CDP-6-deoxy-D-xylo-4-hexulose-3-dehydrase
MTVFSTTELAESRQILANAHPAITNKSVKECFFPTAYSVWGEEEHAAIARVLASGRLTMGPEVEAFEHEFAQWHGMKHAVMVNSGSSANLVAVAAMFHRQDRPLKRGDKVVVPALAWATTYAPLVQHGLELVVADCNDQWNVGQYHGEPAISLQVVCSILGNPAHFWGEAPWPIIEDNCESIGAVDLKRRKCGTRGLMNTFSLFWSHQLSAVEGGVVLTSDDECAELCRMLRAHGWSRDVRKPASFCDEYDFHLMGYNLRPTEIYAAVAREQLRKLPIFIEKRTANWKLFQTLVADLPVKLPVSNGTQSPFGLHFECMGWRGRNHLVHKLREAGIDCRLPTGGSFRRHRYGAPWADQPAPRADRIHDCGLFLGNGPLDLTPQIEKAVGVMREALT